MAIRGTKKTIEALEVFFETGKKPNEQEFFDLLASFYHKDEDISFLINIAKATVTDVQAGENNSRFMTALRTYQAILWWVRLGKLPLLHTDIQELISTNIDNFYNNVLMATNDSDNTINTLGELILAFQNFQEETGGINALRNRIAQLEKLLHQVPDNLRQVQNTFDSLQSQVTTAQNTANTARAEAATAQSTGELGISKGDAAQGTANTARAEAATAQGTGNTARTEAAAAQGTANSAFDLATSTTGRFNTLESYTHGTVAPNAVKGAVVHDVHLGVIYDALESLTGRIVALGG